MRQNGHAHGVEFRLNAKIASPTTRRWPRTCPMASYRLLEHTPIRQRTAVRTYGTGMSAKRVHAIQNAC